MTRFPTHDILSLVGEAARYELGESTGPDLRLAALLEAAGQDSLGAMPLGYATAAGDPQLRQAIAEAHGVHADDVVVTMGGMHALFLSAFILCNRGDEAVTTSPLFPPGTSRAGRGGRAGAYAAAVLRARLPARCSGAPRATLARHETGEPGFAAESFRGRHPPSHALRRPGRARRAVSGRLSVGGRDVS